MCRAIHSCPPHTCKTRHTGYCFILCGGKLSGPPIVCEIAAQGSSGRCYSMESMRNRGRIALLYDVISPASIVQLILYSFLSIQVDSAEQQIDDSTFWEYKNYRDTSLCITNFRKTHHSDMEDQETIHSTAVGQPIRALLLDSCRRTSSSDSLARRKSSGRFYTIYTSSVE